MTRKDVYEYEKILVELQKKLTKESGAQNIGELMRTPEGEAYKASVNLMRSLYALVPPWD